MGAGESRRCAVGNQCLVGADVFDRPVHHRLKFRRVLHLTPLAQHLARLDGAEPGWIAHRFGRFPGAPDFQQKGFHNEFLHAGRLPENTFGVQIEVEVPRLNDTGSAGLFESLTLGGLAVRQVRFDGTLGECPLAPAVGFYQEELDRVAAFPVTDRSTCSGKDLETRSEPMAPNLPMLG